MEVLSDLLILVRSYVSKLAYTGTRWPFLLSSLGVALLSYLYFRRKADGYSPLRFLRFCFPKSVYFHKSSLLDLRYLLTFPIFGGLIFKPALAFSGAGVAYSTTQTLLRSLLGDVGNQSNDPHTLLLVLAFTFVSVLASDFMFFVHHYLQHKVKFLWEFHKVHHSAEVLTPMVDYQPIRWKC